MVERDGREGRTDVTFVLPADTPPGPQPQPAEGGSPQPPTGTTRVSAFEKMASGPRRSSHVWGCLLSGRIRKCRAGRPRLELLFAEAAATRSSWNHDHE